jgi:hypothetical protein
MLEQDLPKSTCSLSFRKAAEDKLFQYRSTGKCHWLNPTLKKTQRSEFKYMLAGWLMGQAIANRSPLQVSLPTLLFQKILWPKKRAYEPSLSEVATFDEEVAASAKQIAVMTTEELAELLELEGREDEIGTVTADDYISDLVLEMSHDSIEWQFTKLRDGFFAACSPDAMAAAGLQDVLLGGDGDSMDCGAVGLRNAVCGPQDDEGADFDLEGVFRVIPDESFTDSPVLVCAFWAVLRAFSVKQKRDLLYFVTGSRRLPVPGFEHIRIEVPFTPMCSSDYAYMLSALPSAHTCDNTLELMDYAAACDKMGEESNVESVTELLRNKLLLAMSSCQGYTLDDIDTSEPAPVTAATEPDERVEEEDDYSDDDDMEDDIPELDG